MSSLIFCTIRAYNAVYNLLKWLLSSPAEHPKVTRYLLSDEYDSDDFEHPRVPENSILIEEWVNADGLKKCNLFYEGEEWFGVFGEDCYSPFTQVPLTPWLWIGDKTTEVDLTAAMQKYIVVGNTIRLDLILHMIQVRENTNIVYIDARTLEEVKFPADGVKIVADDSAH
jgi:hypothetical protein